MLNLKNIFRKTKKQIPFSQLVSTDIHAHLIPRIDDGPKSTEESILLIKGLVALGYKKLIATPHVYSQFYPNSMEDISKAFTKLQEAVVKANISIQLACAAEYYLEDAFEILLNRGQLLKLDDTRVLVETSLMAQDPKLLHYIFNIQMKGLQPVLAHPERYTYMSEADYQQLMDAGCELQLNLLSLEGHYGRDVIKKANYLLKKQYINFVGSDVHHMGHLEKLKKFVRSEKAVKALYQQTLNNNLIT